MTVRVFLLYVGCSGGGTVEMVGGVVWLSCDFLYLAVSFPGWRLFVVGYFVFDIGFFLGIFGNVAVLYILSC